VFLHEVCVAEVDPVARASLEKAPVYHWSAQDER
jgi:hypothetical protein